MAAKKPRLSIVKVDATGAPTDTPIQVEYNPEEYSINQDNNYAVQAIPGLQSPLLQYVNGNLRTLDMELLFDTWSVDDQPNTVPWDQKADVRTLTSQVTDLMDIDPDLHAPPVLKVTWASLQFQCVLAKAAQKFILFRPDGIPVRARLTVTFNEYLTADQQVAQTPKFSSDLSKVHTVVQGETLSDIANQYYNDPGVWRPLAIMNDLDDPRTIFPGQLLCVPSLPFIDPESGEVVS